MQEQQENAMQNDPNHTDKQRMKQQSKNRARERFAESRGIEV